MTTATTVREPMVGRAAELAWARATLARWGRLVVAGSAGVGKTRLAWEVAADAERAVFVPLAHASTRAELFEGVARGFDVSLGGPDVGALLRTIPAVPRALVVFDGADRLADDVCALSEVLRERCDVLSTIRAAPRAARRWTLALGPLEEADAAAWARARLEAVGVRGEGATRAATELVRTFGGHPLALSLGASMARFASPRALGVRVEAGSRDLDGTGLGALATDGLERAGERARRLFAAASVFVDAWTAETVAGVMRAVDTGRTSLPAALERLSMHGLVASAGELGGEPAFRIPDVLRGRACTLAEALGIAAAATREFDAFVVERISSASRAVRGASRGEALRRFETVRAEVLAVFERVAASDPNRAAELAVAFARLAAEVGPFVVSIALLERTEALSCSTEVALSAALARATEYQRAGRFPAARRELDGVARRLRASSSWTARHGRALGRRLSASRGYQAWLQHRFEPAARHFAAALRGGHAGLDAAMVIDLTIRRADVRGDVDALFAVAARARRDGDVVGECHAEWTLGRLLRDLDRPNEAAELGRRSVSLARAGSLRRTLPLALASLAYSLDLAGDVEGAMSAAREAALLHEQNGQSRQRAVVLRHLGFMELGRGHALTARHLFESSRRCAREAGDEAEAALTATALAVVLWRGGARGEATSIAEAASRTLAASGKEGFVEAARAMRAVIGLGTDGPMRPRPTRSRRRRAEVERMAAELLCARLSRQGEPGSGAQGLRVREEGSRSAGELPQGARSAGALEVAASGGWFRVGGGTHVDLTRRAPLARLLALLVAAAAAPKRPLGLAADALVAQVWPGERLPRPVGRNRLRNAVASLRKLGLAPLLLRVGDGYALVVAELVVHPCEPSSTSAQSAGPSARARNAKSAVSKRRSPRP